MTEEEKFQKCVEDIGGLLQKMSRSLQLFEREQIKKTGFTTSQSHIFLELYKTERLQMSEISSKMKLDMSTITRVVEKLIRDGYISKEKNQKDRRYYSISLTEKGKLEAEKMKLLIENYYKKLILRLPKGHVREIMGSVEILMESIERE